MLWALAAAAILAMTSGGPVTAAGVEGITLPAEKILRPKATGTPSPPQSGVKFRATSAVRAAQH
jgi:hypothetical protein